MQLQKAIRAGQPSAGTSSKRVGRARRLLARLNLTALSAEVKDIAVSLSTRVTEQIWAINVSGPALIIGASARASSRRQILTTPLVRERRHSVCIGKSHVRNRPHDHRTFAAPMVPPKKSTKHVGLTGDNRAGLLARLFITGEEGRLAK